MTEVEILRWVLTIVMGGLIWFFKKQIADYDEQLASLKKDHIDVLAKELHEVKLQYVHEKELKEFKEDIKNMFHEIKEDIKELKQ